VTATFDNDVLTAYGFPLNWYTPSIVSSGGYEIALGRLALDLAAYGLVVLAIGTASKGLIHVNRVIGTILKTLLWGTGLISIFLCVTAFSIDPHWTWWDLSTTGSENAPKEHFMSFGLQPRPAIRHGR
jgi:hypothetical protein